MKRDSLPHQANPWKIELYFTIPTTHILSFLPSAFSTLFSGCYTSKPAYPMLHAQPAAFIYLQLCISIRQFFNPSVLRNQAADSEYADIFMHAGSHMAIHSVKSNLWRPSHPAFTSAGPSWKLQRLTEYSQWHSPCRTGSHKISHFQFFL